MQFMYSPLFQMCLWERTWQHCLSQVMGYQYNTSYYLSLNLLTLVQNWGQNQSGAHSKRHNKRFMRFRAQITSSWAVSVDTFHSQQFTASPSAPSFISLDWGPLAAVIHPSWWDFRLPTAPGQSPVSWPSARQCGSRDNAVQFTWKLWI